MTSDRLHDGKDVPTNTTVCRLYDQLKQNGTTANCACFAFLAGYISHTLADARIHPIVNTIAGDNNILHRQCETVQDALLYYQYKQQNIKTSDYLSWLDDCEKRPDDLKDVIERWSAIVNQYYGHHSVKLWIMAYKTGFSIARQVDFYVPGWSYPKPTEIAVADVETFYSAIKLPVTGSLGHFYDDVFRTTVALTAQRWQQIYRRFIDPNDHQGIGDLVRHWNLNDGREMSTAMPSISGAEPCPRHSRISACSRS